mmetsp:Transcript_35880/g.87676  ORF Transcript_35880/g.87676 Transcript_35880/m.87676 type:complete len:475 (-) Transcript_35880:55-1479(-)
MGKQGKRSVGVRLATSKTTAWQQIGAFFTFYKEVTMPLLLSGFLSLIPGLFLTAFTNVFQNVPGLLMMVPALIGMRGNIFGALCSRLSTDVQVNKITVANFTRKVEFFDSFTMFEALFLSFCLPLLCFLAQPLLPAQLSHFDILSFICLCSGLMSGTIMLYCTKYIIRKCIATSLNPDNIGPPVITTIGDMITLPIILLVTWLCLWLSKSMRYAGVCFLLAFTLFSVSEAYKLTRTKTFWATIWERLPVMLVCMAISFVAGIALEHVLVTIGHRPAIQAYMALVPLINAQGGSGGSVIASRTTTRHFLDAAGGGSADGEPTEVDVADVVGGADAAVRRRGGAGDGTGGGSDDESNSVDAVAAAVAAAPPPHAAPLGVVSESIVLTASIWSVYLVVASALFVFTPDLRSYIELVQLMTIMSALIGAACSTVAVVTVRVAVRFRFHPDNVAVPVVCAMMDVVASWGFSLLLVALVR